MENEKKRTGGVTTVREEINKYLGLDIKVGFGVSFVYCDTNTNKTEAEIEYQQTLIIDKMNDKLENLIKQRDYIKRMGVEAWVDKCVESEKKRIDKINEYKRKYGKDLMEFHEEQFRGRKRYFAEHEISTKIASTRREIKEFKPLLDRKVKEVYPSIYRNTWIIVGEGNITGDFWDVEEYRNRYKLQND